MSEALIYVVWIVLAMPVFGFAQGFLGVKIVGSTLGRAAYHSISMLWGALLIFVLLHFGHLN